MKIKQLLTFNHPKNFGIFLKSVVKTKTKYEVEIEIKDKKRTVEQLCKEMVASDLEIFKRDKYLLEGGHSILNFHE